MNNLRKVINWVILLEKNIKGDLEPFDFIEKGEDGNYILPSGNASIEEIGDLESVVYPTFHDMQKCFVRWGLMRVKYLKNPEVNAFSLGDFERIDECKGRVYFQPLKVSYLDSNHKL